MRILVLVGSTREGRKSIHSANYFSQKAEQRGHETHLFDLREKQFPFLEGRTYIEDEEAPEEAEELSREVEKSDFFVIVSPEYNHSIPGVLKNALDHLYPEYDGKNFGYITTSAGGFGGVRALSHLHDITLALGGRPGPSIQVSNISKVFDESGNLEKQEYSDKFEKFLEEIEEF